MDKKNSINKEGFTVYGGRYYYHYLTNILINSEFKDIYLRHCRNRQVHIEKVKTDVDTVKENLANLRQVIFEVTQQCCLKCAYCTYDSGTYTYNRPGSTKSLAMDKAEKILKLIWEIIKDRKDKKFTIG